MSNTEKKTIFVTGGAGYVGKLLVSFLVKQDWVQQVVVLDKQPKPKFFSAYEKELVYLQKNTLDDWEGNVSEFDPDVVIHAAWEIREPYFDKDAYKKENFVGSKKVFKFAFESSAEKLIHFSTVASYGAHKDNNPSDRFVETDDLRQSGYSYADQKLVVERQLRRMQRNARQSEEPTPGVAVLRPASITGPFGRNKEGGFGLQSALSGDLADSDSVWFRLIDKLLFFTPITPKWLRQFVHEDDVIRIVSSIIQEHLGTDYEIFNLAPPGEVMRGRDMAQSVGKPAVEISPQLIRLVFFIVWHTSLGKIPTAPGVWKTYSYPIAVDGSKVADKLDFDYEHTAVEAFSSESGRFADES